MRWIFEMLFVFRPTFEVVKEGRILYFSKSQAILFYDYYVYLYLQI